MGHRDCASECVSFNKETTIEFHFVFISVQTKVVSTVEENQQTQASLHPALDVFHKIFAGIMQQQEQPTTTAPITGKDIFRYGIRRTKHSSSENN